MNGRQHLAVSALVTVVQMANTFLWDQALTTNQDAFWCVAGTVCGWVVTPDLDIDAGTFLQRKRNLLSFIWRAVWWPYAKLVKHRSILSHLPVLGTALRAVYLFPASIALLHLAGTRNAAWFFVGLALQDFAHAFVDYVK